MITCSAPSGKTAQAPVTRASEALGSRLAIPETDDRQLLLWMFRFIRPVKGLAAISCLYVALGVGAEVLTTRQVGRATDQIKNLHIAAGTMARPSGFFNWIGSADFQAAALRYSVGVLFLLVVIMSVLRYLREVANSKFSMNMVFYIREAVYDKVQRVGFGFHDALSSGTLINRALSDLQNVRGFVQTALLTTLEIVLVVGGYIFLLMTRNPYIAVLALMPLPIWVWYILRFSKIMQPVVKDSMEEGDRNVALITENVAGVHVIKAFATEQQEIIKYGQNCDLFYAKVLKRIKLLADFNPIIRGIATATNLSLILAVCALVIFRKLSAGDILVVQASMQAILGRLQAVAQINEQYQNAIVSSRRLYEVLMARPNVPERPDAKPLPAGRGDVRFENLSFGYDAAKPVLHDIDLHVKGGSVVAVVGPTGAGKTTLVNLIARFYDPQQGRILIDGIDLRDVKLDSLRKEVAFVFQETYLFSDTVEANIAYGRPHITGGEVEAAARLAQAHEFIETLPLGYQTVLRERGSSLSGGQKQRLAIARAILTNPRILVLDDATAAVDPETEGLIRKGMKFAMYGRTTFVIAHRLSTVRVADVVIVMQDGRISQVGSHAELMKCEGHYRDIAAAQLYGEPGADEDESPSHMDRIQGKRAFDGRPRPMIRKGRSPWDGMRGYATTMSNISLPFTAGTKGAKKPAGGAALEEEPDETMYKPIDLKMVRRLFGWFAPYKWRYATGISLGIVIISIWSTSPKFVGYLADYTTQQIKNNFVTATRSAVIWHIVLVMLVWAAINAVAMVLDSYRINIMLSTGEHVQFDLRRAMFLKLQQLSMSYYDRTKLGRIISRCTSDVNSLREVSVWGIDAVIINVARLLIASVMMVISSNWQLFFSVAWLGPIIYLLNRMYLRRAGVGFQIQREGFTRVSTNLAENINGVRVVTAFNRQSPNLGEFNRLQEINTENNVAVARLNGKYQPMLGVIGFIGKVIILTYGGYLVVSRPGIVTVGSVISAFLYWDYFMDPIIQMGVWYNTYMQAMAGGERVFDLLDTEPDVVDVLDAKPLPRIEGHVKFEDVVFGYNAERPVLHGINFEAKPGQMIALVGATGSGKSSIVSLIARFYQPQQGRVLVDGHDIRHFTGDSLHKQMGLVLQVNYLFTGTVMENIRYIRPDATDQDVIDAAKAIGSHEVILGLNNGYQTNVGERGANMSLGQRQLICFTRAFLADPRIFMLDEATSAVDTATELAVQRSLEKLLAGRTTFVVAHRLSTIMAADLILVIDAGQIIERGTHRQLLTAGGKYAYLYEQFVQHSA